MKSFQVLIITCARQRFFWCVMIVHTRTGCMWLLPNHHVSYFKFPKLYLALKIKKKLGHPSHLCTGSTTILWGPPTQVLLSFCLWSAPRKKNIKKQIFFIVFSGQVLWNSLFIQVMWIHMLMLGRLNLFQENSRFHKMHFELMMIWSNEFTSTILDFFFSEAS